MKEKNVDEERKKLERGKTQLPQTFIKDFRFYF